MFVQFIRAPAGDAKAIRSAMARWDEELRPGAEGFLGSTSGVTTDNEFVLVARFETEAAARRNSDRPEQGQWWAEVEKGLAGPASFFESIEIDEAMGGGRDDAGFVQVMLGRADRQTVKDAMAQAEPVMRRERPDVIGGITAWGPDGGFIDVTYFTSEAEAREGEAKELSEEAARMFSQFQQIMAVDEWLDVPEPQLS